MKEYTAKEEGYVFMYVSNENATLVDVYFDDVVMTHTKSNVIQYNEYYPFGMSTANSWTRENTIGNNFLFNGGTELNTTSSVYDLYFRNYDPVLGRMNQIDPMATSFAGLSPYNYSFNDPVTYNDPMGDCPTCPKYQRSDDTWWVASRQSLYGSRYTGFSSARELAFQNQAVNISTNPWAWTGMGSGAIYGPSFEMLGAGSNYAFGSPSTAEMNADARAVQDGSMNIADYAAKYGAAISVDQLRSIVNHANAGGQFAGGNNSIEMMQVYNGSVVLTNASGEPMKNGEVFGGAAYWYYDKIELKHLKSLVGNKILGLPDNGWRTPWFFTDGFFNPVKVAATKTNFEQLDFVVGTGFSNTAQIGNYNARLQAYHYTSTRSQLATQLRGAKYLNIGAKGLGVFGGVIGGIQSALDGNFTIGDASKMVFSIAMVFTGPVGIAYTIADIAVGFGTGYSITDRIGIGVDYSLSR